MGEEAANMVLTNTPSKIKNDFNFIDRQSI